MTSDLKATLVTICGITVLILILGYFAFQSSATRDNDKKADFHEL